MTRTAARSGGVVSGRQLQAWGNTKWAVRRALQQGSLVRLRQGWFALPGADAKVTAAVRAGGSLGCASALRRHGVWVRDASLHIRASEHGLRRLPPNAHLCRLPGSRVVPAHPVDDLRTALVTASQCQSDEDFVAILDSVVNLGLMHAEEVGRLFVDGPLRVRRCVQQMDRAESGTETLVRLRLRSAKIAVQPQVWIAGIGRVDFLVGRSLVIEVDSIEHHTSPSAYQADRARDRRLHALGYVVLRVTYQQVLDDWPAVEADILAAMRDRAHRRRVRTCR